MERAKQLVIEILWPCRPRQGTQATTTKKWKFWPGTTRFLLIVCVLALPAYVLLGDHDPASLSDLFGVENTVMEQQDTENGWSQLPEAEYDRLLGGLLLDGFDEQSCLSRYQFARYHKKSSRSPSTYLIQKLRKHEALQRKCGPGTDSYNQAVKKLKSKHVTNTTTECNYLVFISYNGLGNRMLAIASAFLYAVLTERVLLLDLLGGMGEIFCEPFYGTSWLAPSDLRVRRMRNFDDFVSVPERYGNLLKNKISSVDGRLIWMIRKPPFVFLNLDGKYDFFDRLFFCEDEQRLLEDFQWLVIRTESYFLPGLFMIPAFQEELNRLFPDKEAVFHHLGRYLFHPSNDVWHSILKYYYTYLASADRTVGIQIRTYGKHFAGQFQEILDQAVACTQNEKLLPKTTASQEPMNSTRNPESLAVLVTSLSSWYSDKIKDMYRKHPPANGQNISISQPSHEGRQKLTSKVHDMKALAEIYLLSLTDELVTSGFSTFGYVAQSLGGLRPWIMFRVNDHSVPDPPYARGTSMEPCFHKPPYYDCKAKVSIDTSKILPYIKRCEDVGWGVKLFNQSEW